MVRIFLPTFVFSHGQLYVAIAIVIPREWLNILLTDEDCEYATVT